MLLLIHHLERVAADLVHGLPGLLACLVHDIAGLLCEVVLHPIHTFLSLATHRSITTHLLYLLECRLAIASRSVWHGWLKLPVPDHQYTHRQDRINFSCLTITIVTIKWFH